MTIFARAFALSVGFSISLNAYAVPTKDLVFANGAHLKQHFVIDFSGILQKLYFKNGSEVATVAWQPDVTIYSPASPTPLDFGVALVNGNPFIIDQAGTVSRTLLNTTKIESWTGTRIQFNGQDFYVVSFLHADKTGSTLVVRGADGAAVTVDTRYHMINSQTVRLEGNKINIEGRSISVSPLELNDHFVAGKSTPLSFLARKQIQTPSDFARINSLNDSNVYADRLYNALSGTVYGQEPMVRKLSDAFARSTVRPMVKPHVVVLTGPSGVGKSLVARKLGIELYGDEKFVLELDGNEQKSAIEGGNIEHHKWFGAPHGQRGGQKGQLTEWLKSTKGNGVLIINEGDKMHPDIWMRLMEFFDTGKISDGRGNVIYSGNLEVILTSNRGIKTLFPDSVKDWSQEELQKYAANLSSDQVKQAYKTPNGPDDRFILPDEVLGRVDEFITAIPLTKEASIQIVHAEAIESMKVARTQYDVNLAISQDIVSYIGSTGFSNIGSGRLIRRQAKKIFDTALLKISKSWKLRKNDTVDVTLTYDEKGHPEMTLTYKGNHVAIDLPREPNRNPLNDAELVERIKKFPENLRKIIIGQEEMIGTISDILIAQYGDQFRVRPASIYLIGSTGTGKTETGHAIAFARYGSANRVSVIPFGGVHNEAGFNSIFGVEPGYDGAKVVRAFEKALRDNPDGGVIVCDEISNMGGGKEEIKRALFTKLYNMIEEGTWTSPISPDRVYDLSKYTFVFTGNDAENLFKGITADDVRMSNWNNNKDPANVRKLLADAGVPEAFLGRMDLIYLMKPLLRAEVHGIGAKMMKQKQVNWREQHKGAEFNFAPNFDRDLARAFFSQDQGGRSLRKVLDSRVGSLVTSALIEIGAYPDEGKTKGLKINLSIEDNTSRRPYLRRNAPKRQVNIRIQIERDGKEIYNTVRDTTDFAAFSLLMDPERATLVAFHEAGHGIMNVESVTGEELELISLFGGKAGDLQYLGYARYEKIKGLTPKNDRDSVILHIAQLCAGREAQNMAGFKTDEGWTNDLEKIRKITGNYLTKWGDDELLGLPVDKDGNVMPNERQKDIIARKADELIAEATIKAHAYLELHWPIVRTIAAELLTRGEVNGKRFKELREYVERNEHPAVGHRNWTYQQFMEEEQRRRAGRKQVSPDKCEEIFKTEAPVPGLSVKR